MNSRLDLSAKYLGYYNPANQQELMTEALRAQASEDALSKRVEVLEVAINEVANELWIIPNHPLVVRLKQALHGAGGGG